LDLVANSLPVDDELPCNEEKCQNEQSSASGDADISQTRAEAIVIAGEVASGTAGIARLVAAFPAMPSEVSTSEFLAHCEAAPEPCKKKVLAYVKLLADGEFLDRSIMQLPARDLAANSSDGCAPILNVVKRTGSIAFDDAIAMLKLCKSLTALLDASSLRFRNKVELDLIQGGR
jgi:hypothetical protein